MKKVISVICVILVMFILVAGAILAYLSVDEFNPEEVESLEINYQAHKKIEAGKSLRIMTWNMGYGALGDNADFFMDGGRMVYTADEDRVNDNLNDMVEEIDKDYPDILFVQEIDRNSARSHFLDEAEFLRENGKSEVFAGAYSYAPNFKVAFIPLPVPPIGKVDAGIAVFSDYEMVSSDRIKLPCPFKWPLSTMNLKRCLEVVRMPVENSDKELVLVNLHLEAYDSGEGKLAQTRELNDLLTEEVEKGNYVIAGGDFNQTFSDIDVSAYPVQEREWQAGLLDVNEFSEMLSFYTDTSAPTCRSLARVLATAKSKDPKDFQYYVIDGFIVSSNITVKKIETRDLGFVSSDHNPIVMDFVMN